MQSDTHGTKTLCKIVLRNVRFFVSFETATPHFRTILKNLYLQRNKLSCTSRHGRHTLYLSFVLAACEREASGSKKRHRPYWNYFLAAARAHNYTVPLRNSALSITPTLSNDKTIHKFGKETFRGALSVRRFKMRVFRSLTIYSRTLYFDYTTKH